MNASKLIFVHTLFRLMYLLLINFLKFVCQNVLAFAKGAMVDDVPDFSFANDDVSDCSYSDRDDQKDDANARGKKRESPQKRHSKRKAAEISKGTKAQDVLKANVLSDNVNRSQKVNFH